MDDVVRQTDRDLGVLDYVTHGYLYYSGDEISFINRGLRSILGGEFGDIPAIIRQYPQLSFLRDLEENDTVSRWIDLDGSLFRVQIFNIEGKERLTVFIPSNYLAGGDSEHQEIQQAYDDFVEIFQNCFDGIYVADGSGKTLWLNQGFERCYGLSARKFIGRNVSELEREGYIKPIITWKVITTKQRTTALQETKTGRKVLATGIPLLDKEGRVRKVIINSRDMTELVELQERLQNAEKAIEQYETELSRLRKEATPDGDLVWKSERMGGIVDLALRIANFDTTLLITGESGVGKEVIASLVHRNSPRKDGPFMQINCSAIPADLLESELFGYEEGAFTGSAQRGKAGLLELADGGTLFLDEVGEMPLNLQVKLLRVLQDQTFTRVGGVKQITTNFRIIAATNRDLKTEVEKGRFREDLYYRLSVVPIEVPPLRERLEDVIGLAYHFLDSFNQKYGFSKRLSDSVMERLGNHHWPGNVRELRNLIERLVVMSPHRVIRSDDIPVDAISPPAREKTPDAGIAEGTPSAEELKSKVALYESTLIREVVDQCGSIRKAANETGISESTIKRKLRQ